MMRKYVWWCGFHDHEALHGDVDNVLLGEIGGNNVNLKVSNFHDSMPCERQFVLRIQFQPSECYDKKSDGLDC